MGNAPIPRRIVQPVLNAERTTLTGNTPPLARAQFDQGAVPDAAPANRMLLVLKRSDSQEAELKQLVADQQNPASESFHKWLKAEEFGGRFGPAVADVDQVTAWLQTQGFTVNQVGRGRQVVDFSGTAGQVSQAFHTELHTYSREGVTFHANSSDPQVPSALAPLIAGFASLNDIKPQSYKHVMGSATMDPKTHRAVGQWNDAEQCSTFANGKFTNYECTYYPPTPGDLAVQYNVNPVYKAGTTGKGVTIGVVSDSNVDMGVVQRYRTLFGFANPANVPVVTVDGNDPGQDGDAVEAYLDVEAASAMAPDATINLYVSASTLTTSGIVNAIARAVDDDVADVITVSYGACEQFLGAAGNQFFYDAWEQAAAQGQSVFVSAGDGGSAGCDNFNQVSKASLGLAVSGFASTPFNTAVGGTDLYYSQYAEGRTGTDLQSQVQTAWGTTLPTTNPLSTLLAPVQEQPWNIGYGLDIIHSSIGSSIVAGSGGASACVTGTGVDPVTLGYTACTGGYAKPSWQVGTGVPADKVRDLPDVSLFASGGTNLSFWPICAGIYDCRTDASDPNYSVALTGVGGTSASSPAMAGIMALVDQSQKSRQGNANYALYALAAQFPNTFNDVTIGSNNTPCVKGTPNCSLDTNGDGYYTLQQYSATAGYDQATGLGSVNVANLISNWGKITFQTTSTALSLSSTTVVHGAAVTVKANVAAASGNPKGSVALVSTSTIPGEVGIGAIELTGGSGSSAITYLPGGTYQITGRYSGDGVFGTSTSAAASLTVTAEPSTSVLVATDYNNNVYPLVATILKSGGTIAYDDPLILDVTVNGASKQGVPTGPVTFMDGTTSIGTANISSSGVAELITGALLPGKHSISTSYAGDGSFNASTTAAFPLTVTQGATTVSAYYNTVYLSGQPSIYAGQPFLLSATVYGGSVTVAPTGTLTFNVGNLPPQTVTLQPSYAGLYTGFATATFNPVTPGSYTVSVTYSGDANYAPVVSRTSQVAVVVPTLVPSTVTLTSSSLTVAPNDVFVLKAAVAGSVSGVVPTGNLTFYVGHFALTVALDATGKASLTLAGQDLQNGGNIVYAQYKGDKVYSLSSSSLQTVTADVGDFSLTTANPALTMKSGATGSTTLFIAQSISSRVVSGLTGAVNLTCTPASAAITCAIASPSLTLPANGAQASTTLTINSHLPTAQTTPPAGLTPARKLLGGGVALATLLCVIPFRRRRLGSLLALVLMATVGLGLSGCSQTSPPVVAAPVAPTNNAVPGTYLVTVTGTVQGVQHTLALTVYVQ